MAHGQIGPQVGVALAVAILGVQNYSLTQRYHDEAGKAKASDEHIGTLIDANVNPKLDKINHQLDKVIKELGQVQGTLHIYASAQDALKSRIDQQMALASMTDPKRIDRALAVIRIEIKKARSTKQPISASAIQEYKMVVRALPDTAEGYWKTVAAIINFQSLRDQEIGTAPDPKTVASVPRIDSRYRWLQQIC